MIAGNAGNNVLNGALGDDTLYGGAGNDTFNDWSGNDTMTGGAGNDTFIFATGSGQDTITDFDATNSAEKINLSGVAQITDFADLSTNHMSQVGANVLIDDGAGTTVTLLGVNIADLDGGDFLF